MIAQPRKNIMDLFIDGARRGFTIATTSLLPNESWRLSSFRRSR